MYSSIPLKIEIEKYFFTLLVKLKVILYKLSEVVNLNMFLRDLRSSGVGDKRE